MRPVLEKVSGKPVIILRIEPKSLKRAIISIIMFMGVLSPAHLVFTIAH